MLAAIESAVWRIGYKAQLRWEEAASNFLKISLYEGVFFKIFL